MAELLDRVKAAVADRYAVEREIGAGGMATVYLAEDLRHHRKVALKVLRPELAATLGAERFLREIEIAAALTHPHILPLHDSGETDGFLYYVMPFIEGESLRQKLSAEGQLGISEATRILKEVTDALAEAHAKGVVHRDIKPENVLLSGRHALVTDFGVAKAVTDATTQYKLTTAGLALGTPHYMAPEQATADPSTDHRADIYAVGVIGYEMLTGRTPIGGSTAQAILAAHVSEIPEPVAALRTDVPPILNDAIMRCLAKDPQDRWGSAGELLGVLETLITTPTGGLTPVGTRPTVLGVNRRLATLVAVAVLAVVLIAAGLPKLFAGDRARWVREQAIPQIEQHVEAGGWEAAYRLANEASAILPDDPILRDLWSTFTRVVSIESEPAGAMVFRQEYSVPSAEWEELGRTPLDSIRIPYGYSRFRLEREGFATLLAADGGSSIGPFTLDTAGTLPEGMVRVRGWTPEVQGERLALADFFIDRFEVTNREFKEFVDAGGYGRRELWEHPFERDGRTLSWDAAIAHFVDKTGRPGPSTWEVGDYPAGQDDYPVTGVSWYEAAAYARFVDKELPTVHHWRRAYGVRATSWMAPLSNLDSGGPAPVGEHQGISYVGAYDMAGNVREWCYNSAGETRFILGAGWNDPYFLAMNVSYSQLPFDRSATNGFRLATYRDAEAALLRARLPVPVSRVPDVARRQRVSDDLFDIYRRMYAYDPNPLNAVVETIDTTRHWTRERISFDASYGGERLILYLHLPINKRGPFHTVVYFPGTAALHQRSIDEWRTIHLDFAVKSGRAVAFPVYKGTFERDSELASTAADRSNLYREHVIQWAKDLRRSVDYLETRGDIDAGRLAYYGYSWGGRLAPIMLALEPRFDAAVLYVAGVDIDPSHPEVDPINFLPRATTPLLMLSGRLDVVFPLETSARPMFELFGTPPEHKRHVISDGGHFVPRTQLISETLDWLDRYLGPVN